MSAAQNLSLAQSWFERVWNGRDRDAIREICAPDLALYDSGQLMQGRAEFEAYYDRMRATFAEVRVDVEDTIADGDRVCVRWTAHLRHTGEGLGFPAAGRTATVSGMTMIEIREGKFVKGWQNWDMLGLLNQLKEGSRTAAAHLNAASTAT